MLSPNIKARLAELDKIQDRLGRTRMTTEERCDYLNEIYDALIFFWLRSALTGSAKGTSSIIMQLQGARLEMGAWEPKTNGDARKPSHFLFQTVPENLQAELDEVTARADA